MLSLPSARSQAPRTDVYDSSRSSADTFKVVNADFAELSMKGEGRAKIQSLLAIVQCTAVVAALPGREDANGVITLLSRDIFKDLKKIISDKEPAFKSKHSRSWPK